MSLRTLALSILALAVQDLHDTRVPAADRASARALLEGKFGTHWFEAAGLDPHEVRRRVLDGRGRR